MNVSLQTSVSALLLVLDLWRWKQGEELCVPVTWCSTIRRMAYEIARAQGGICTAGACAHGRCACVL
jgi:hypothetical protein